MSSIPTVVLDANVLYGNHIRSFLVYVALTGVVRMRWSERILDECFENLKARRTDLDATKLDRTRALMNRAVPDAIVTGFEGLESALELPDPDDRHVLAAAIKSGAQIIVTFNRKDFPASSLEPWGVEAMTPDSFILDLLDLEEVEILQALGMQHQALKRPPLTMGELLGILSRDGLSRSSELMRHKLGLLH